MKTKVLIFPYDTNPYQELLYKNMDGVDKRYLLGVTKSRSLNNLLLPFQIIYYRLKGFRLFHLHWAYGFTFPGNNLVSTAISTLYYYFMLLFIKFCGYKVVWTVHNLLPHKQLFLNDRKARIFLSKIADTKIVHSEVTIKEMVAMGMDTKNIKIINIGSFIDYYPNTVSKPQARRNVGISEKDFVYLFIGRVEKYKGLEKLVDEFVKQKLPNSKLVLAGKCVDDDLRNILNRESVSDNVVFDNNYIENIKIQDYMNSADIVVYPFERITTSSSVLLAFSFGKAIIYPLIGNLTDLPKNVGIPYSISDKDGLKNSLLRAYKNIEKIKELNENAYKYAKILDWKEISDKTERVYKELVS